MASPRDENRSAFPWVRWLEDVSKGLGCAKRESPKFLVSRPAPWNSPRAYAQDIESIASTQAPDRRGVAPLRAVSRKPYLADNLTCNAAFTVSYRESLLFPPGAPSSGAEGPVAESPPADFWCAESDAHVVWRKASDAHNEQQDSMRRERRMVEVQLDAIAMRIKMLMDQKEAAGDLNAQRMYLSPPHPPPGPHRSLTRPRSSSPALPALILSHQFEEAGSFPQHAYQRENSPAARLRQCPSSPAGSDRT